METFFDDPSAQLVTEILDTITTTRMKAHVQEGMRYGLAFEPVPTMDRARQFIIDVVKGSNTEGGEDWIWEF